MYKYLTKLNKEKLITRTIRCAFFLGSTEYCISGWHQVAPTFFLLDKLLSPFLLLWM